MASRAPILVADGLWQCLCPAFGRPFHTTTRSRSIQPHSRRSRIQDAQSTRKPGSGQASTHTASAPTWGRGPPVRRERKPLQPVADELLPFDEETYRIPATGRQDGVSDTKRDGYDEKAENLHLGRGTQLRNPEINRPRSLRIRRVRPDTPDTEAASLWKSALADALAARDAAAEEGHKDATHKAVHKLIHDLGQVPDAQHYAALIAAEADPTYGSADGVERWLKQLDADGLAIDGRILEAALKALAIHPNYLLREQILADFERRWLDLSTASRHHVVAALLRERQLELGLERLAQLPRATGQAPAPWLLHLAIATCLSADAFPEAQTLLKQRLTYPQPISTAIWAAVLTAAANARCHPLVDFVWRRAVEMDYLNPSSGTCTAVLDTAAQHGNFRLATDVFRVLGARNSPLQPHHYESLHESYLRANDLPTALGVLGLMSRAGLAVDAGALRPLVHYLAADAAQRVPHCLGLLADPTARPTPERPHPKKTDRDKEEDRTPALTACVEALVTVAAGNAALTVWRHWAHYAGGPSEDDVAPSGQRYRDVLRAPTPGTHVYNCLFRSIRAFHPTQRAALTAELLAAMDRTHTPMDALTLDRLILLQLPLSPGDEPQGDGDVVLGPGPTHDAQGNYIAGATVPPAPEHAEPDAPAADPAQAQAHDLEPLRRALNHHATMQARGWPVRRRTRMALMRELWARGEMAAALVVGGRKHGRGDEEGGGGGGRLVPVEREDGGTEWAVRS